MEAKSSTTASSLKGLRSVSRLNLFFMMPYDHAAVGYLFSFLLLRIAHAALLPEQINFLLLWGLFWAVAVDWDMIVSALMLKSLKMQDKVSHRRFFTHTPIFGLVIGLTMYFFSGSLYGQYFALVFLAAFASHMVVDSIEIGIMWFWPFSRKQYFLFDCNSSSDPYLKENFFMFHIKMFRNVYMKMKTFYVGIVTVIIALIVFFTN